jgi:hypothetical protein
MHVLPSYLLEEQGILLVFDGQQVRVSVKRKATDISTRPAKIIRQTLQETDESHLQPSHLKSISLIKRAHYV